MPTKELVKSINELVRERIQKRIEEHYILNDPLHDLDEDNVLKCMNGINAITEKTRFIISIREKIKQN